MKTTQYVRQENAIATADTDWQNHPAWRMLDRFCRRRARDRKARDSALRLAKGEFALSASFKGIAFSTTRNRSRKLAHIQHSVYSIWRVDWDTHELMRLVARGLCGQWIVSAQPVEWGDGENGCAGCLAVARELVAEQAQEELTAAAEEVSA